MADAANIESPEYSLILLREKFGLSDSKSVYFYYKIGEI